MKTHRLRIRLGRAVLWATIVLATAVGACAGGDSESFAADVDMPIDTELAGIGEQLFAQRGCVACHKIGEGRLVGPDLQGVTGRRSYDWIYAMITAPDSMLQTDSTVKRLFAEYFTPMPNQKVQLDEARALYEYLRTPAETP